MSTATSREQMTARTGVGSPLTGKTARELTTLIRTKQVSPIEVLDAYLAAIEALCTGARFAPEPLTEKEKAALAPATLANAPPHVAGEYPEWLDPYFARAFGDDRAAEGAALASRAPLDLRVNTLKSDREELVPKLAHLGAEPTRWSPIGLMRELLERHELVLSVARPGGHEEHSWSHDFAVGQVVLSNDLQAWSVSEQAALPRDNPD